MKPIIRWAGSKRQLLSKLTSYWRDSEARYIEPFAGSACLFFHLEPRNAVLGDLNEELVTTYRALKRDPALVWECLRRIPTGKGTYYRLREQDPATLAPSIAAARFLYLNRNCFNGIYRTNRQGKFNVPYGPPRGGGTMKFARLLEAAVLLKRATLLNADFEETLRFVQKGDFVYLDPPYAVIERRIFSEYHPTAFSTGDLARLEKSLRDLDSRGAHFVLSYADSAEAREICKIWNVRRIRTRRHIAGFARHRRSVYEIIATNMIV